MNMLEIINAVHQGISPYIAIEDIEISIKKEYKIDSFRLKVKEENTLPFNMGITIFYDRESNNFTTDFYDWQPKPKSIQEIISKILETAKKQQVPIQIPKKSKLNMSDASLF